MLYIEGKTIRLTRGDTAYLRIPLKIVEDANNTDSEASIPYEMLPEDTLTFSVKKNTRDTEPILQKIVTGDNTFHIEPNDTAELNFAKYTYDVQLDTKDGDVFTVIPPSTFEVLKEVTSR